MNRQQEGWADRHIRSPVRLRENLWGRGWSGYPWFTPDAVLGLAAAGVRDEKCLMTWTITVCVTVLRCDGGVATSQGEAYQVSEGEGRIVGKGSGSFWRC